MALNLGGEHDKGAHYGRARGCVSLSFPVMPTSHLIRGPVAAHALNDLRLRAWGRMARQ